MIDFKQAHKFVTKTLIDMKAYSPDAVTAIMMIAAHESLGGTYLTQVGSGIALGFGQIEKPTHDTVWRQYDNIKVKSDLMGIKEDFARLEYDLRYSVFIMRCYLLMDIRPLPKTDEAMAVYLKEYWNTNLGAATPLKYLEDYKSWKNS